MWIPVDGTTLKYEKHTYEMTSVDDTTPTEDTGNGYWDTQYYRGYSEWTDNGGNSESVKENGGFYVGRFEAGVPSNANFYADSAGDKYYTTEKNVTTYVPVSKARNQSWNFISQVNAKTVSTKMYEGNNSVTSQLIDRYAWDTITTWMDNEISGIAADSTNYGNYNNRTLSVTNTLFAQHIKSTGWTIASTYSYGAMASPLGDGTNCIELATGATDNTKIKNIYDFAGNLHEWTTETGYISARAMGVARGGCFGDDGISHAVSFCWGGAPQGNAAVYLGFRVVLYLSE